MNKKMTRRTFGAVGCALAFTMTPSIAQQPFHISCTIEKVDGQVLMFTSCEGANLFVEMADNMVTMADNVHLTGTVAGSLADIKPGVYMSVVPRPQDDGIISRLLAAVFPQEAIVIHIFRDWQRGTAEGWGPYHLEPGSTDMSVARVDGRVVTVKYKDGDRKVIVMPETFIFRYVEGTKDDLKPGQKVHLFNAIKKPDGTIEAPTVIFRAASLW